MAKQPPGTGPLNVSLAELAVFDVRAVKDSARWARHVDLTVCNGNHDWECDKAACPDCWQPRCDPNAEKDQSNYKAAQQGTGAEQARTYKKNNLEKIKKKNHEPTGPLFENAAIDKLPSNEIVALGYKAHCSRCHMVGDLDIVTKTRVIECKKNPKTLSLDQMTEKIIPIATKCFPGKKITVATPAAKLGALENKLSTPAWASHNLGAIDP